LDQFTETGKHRHIFIVFQTRDKKPYLVVIAKKRAGKIKRRGDSQTFSTEWLAHTGTVHLNPATETDRFLNRPDPAQTIRTYCFATPRLQINMANSASGWVKQVQTSFTYCFDPHG
jgi:hypothetical protein